MDGLDAPWRAPGMRAAVDGLVQVGASTSRNPSASLVSAYGPSVAIVWPSVTRKNNGRRRSHFADSIPRPEELENASYSPVGRHDVVGDVGGLPV
jgi:hypothetical protein